MAAWREMTLVGLDTETTGLSTREDRIFEIGLTTYEKGELKETWGELVDPGRALSDITVEKTGVTQAEVTGKPPLSAVVGDVLKRIEGQVVVGYNLVDFDVAILKAELDRLNLEMPEIIPVDALVFTRGLVKKGRHGLGDMVKHYGITMENAHRATADADATVRLLLAMAPELPAELDDLLVLQAQWAEEYRQKRATWRKLRGQQPEGGQDSLLRQEFASTAHLVSEDGKPTLGPGYLYGRETDPIRAFIEAYLALTSKGR